MPSRPAGKRRYLATSPFNAAREAAQAKIVPIPVGARVSHERHGMGRVVALDGTEAVIVDFGGGQHLRVALDSPRLEVL
ncbi:hypothetical protein J4G33_14535 [Actinotalea sp. BY-33]|uniref:Uncharacterized protein n=1 Tax=Actinotalea soli TaxID=2819234 RepID=A0A939LQT8_9CELL|nr:hypothetical protein [Actinotalea soli]MBO1753027.1 hypothetical protein [Actinotalea soli]